MGRKKLDDKKIPFTARVVVETHDYLYRSASAIGVSIPIYTSMLLDYCTDNNVTPLDVVKHNIENR